MWALVAVAFVLALAASKRKVEPVITHFVGLGENPVVPVPDSEDGFRRATAPSADAFRTEAFFGHSFNETQTVTHELPFADVAPDANGTLVLSVFATLQGDESRCTAWTWSIRIENGRVVTGNAFPLPPNDARARRCPTGTSALNGPMPGSAGPDYGSNYKAILQNPQVNISQRGGKLWLTWKTRIVRGDKWGELNGQGYDATGFYVDALWQFAA